MSLKEANRIGRTIDNLMKITDDLEKNERKTELINVIHQLSIVHQNVLGDLTRDTVNDTV